MLTARAVARSAASGVPAVEGRSTPETGGDWTGARIAAPAADMIS
jgi:hypothetical protein